MTLPRYPVYQDSGVEWLGKIPVHWRAPRLKTLLQETDERAGDKEAELLGLSKSLGVVKRSELDQGAAASDDYGKYKLVHPGELVMNKMQAWNGVFGMSATFGMVSPDYATFRFLRSEVGAYLTSLFRTEAMAGVFFTRCRGMGVAFLRLNSGDFLDIKVPLPPSEEVRAIASFLDSEIAKIDALIAEQEKLIALLAEKRQATISHAVTRGLNHKAPMKDSGVPWLGEVPAHWRVGKAGFYSSILPGYAFPSTGFSLDEGDTRLLRGINVGVGELRWDEVVYWRRAADDGLDAFNLQPGDVVIGMDRPLISTGMRVAMVSENDLPCLLLQRVAKIQPGPEMDSRFIMRLLGSRAFEAHFAPETTGVSVPHISGEQITDFVIPVAPMDEQREICDFLEGELGRLASLQSEAESAVDLLRERRSALIAAAVTGQIDVRGVVPQPAPLQDEVPA